MAKEISTFEKKKKIEKNFKSPVFQKMSKLKAYEYLTRFLLVKKTIILYWILVLCLHIMLPKRARMQKVTIDKQNRRIF